MTTIVYSPYIEVFQTSVEQQADAARLQRHFEETFPDIRVSFDLDDVDRIMRVVATPPVIAWVQTTMQDLGYQCQSLPE